MAEWIGAMAGAVAATVAVIGLLIGRSRRRSSPHPDNPTPQIGQPVDMSASVPGRREKASPFWVPFIVVHVLLIWRMVFLLESHTGLSGITLPPDGVAFILALAAVVATLPICARLWTTKRIFAALVAVLVVVPLLAFDVLVLVGITVGLAE